MICKKCGYDEPASEAVACGLCGEPLKAKPTGRLIGRAKASAPPAPTAWDALEPDAYAPPGALERGLTLVLPCLAVAVLVVNGIVWVGASTSGGGPEPLAGLPPGAALALFAALLAFGGLVLVALPMWLLWIYYAYRNARALAEGLTFSPAVATLLVLIPLLNLATSWLVLWEVYRSSHPEADPLRWRQHSSGAGIVHAYGALCLIGTLGSSDDSLGTLAALGSGAVIVGLTCTAFLVRSIGERQAARHQRVVTEQAGW